MSLFLLFLFLRPVCIDNPHTPSTPVPFTDPHIHYMGRIKITDSAALLYWTASSATIRFNGTGITATLRDERGDNYYTIIIDGTVSTTLHLDAGKHTYPLAQNLKPGAHTVQLYKRTEWAMGKTWLYDITPDAKTKLLPPPPAKKHKIEFFGNSITCGYAVEDMTGKDRGTAPYENAYIAYASLTARHFNAAYNCIAKSGIGITISWFPLIMPEMYDRLDPEDPDSKWDFSKFTPDLVVVNLFQNDAWLTNMPTHEQFRARFGTTPPTPEFIIDAYKNFVKQVRTKYPNAYIICMLGNMDATKEGAPWPGYIQKAVDQQKDRKIYTLFVPYKNTSGHPSRGEQKVLADSLIKFIDKHIHW